MTCYGQMQLSKMVDYKAAIQREDSREYYALTQIPEDFFRIFVENLQNYILNHLTKLPNLNFLCMTFDKLKLLEFSFVR